MSTGSALVATTPQLAYDLAPRAVVFRRNHSLVQDMETFQRLMRYNNYLHDPVAKGNPWNQISARGDLDIDSPSCIGGYDTKATSNALYQEMIMFAQVRLEHGIMSQNVAYPCKEWPDL